jgi:hypothetical protein
MEDHTIRRPKWPQAWCNGVLGGLVGGNIERLGVLDSRHRQCALVQRTLVSQSRGGTFCERERAGSVCDGAPASSRMRLSTRCFQTRTYVAFSVGCRPSIRYLAALVVLVLYAVQSELRFGQKARTILPGPNDRGSTLAVSLSSAIPVLGFVLAMKTRTSPGRVLLPRWLGTIPGMPACDHAGGLRTSDRGH